MSDYYSNGMAVVNGYDEAYSAGQDEAFSESEGAIAARLHNAQEAAQLEAEMADFEGEVEEVVVAGHSWLYDLI